MRETSARTGTPAGRDGEALDDNDTTSVASDVEQTGNGLEMGFDNAAELSLAGDSNQVRPSTHSLLSSSASPILFGEAAGLDVEGFVREVRVQMSNDKSSGANGLPTTAI